MYTRNVLSSVISFNDKLKQIQPDLTIYLIVTNISYLSLFLYCYVITKSLGIITLDQYLKCQCI